MDETRWRRVEALFAAAVDLDTVARQTWLERECGDDRELLHELESLFAADDRGDLLTGMVESAAAHLVAERDNLSVGHRLGPWLVTERIGEGGMSVVYRASRAAAQFHEQVALKVLKRRMDSDDILRRFSAERKILARLEHPGIARLLDGGTTPDGRPYFVMELVAGVPIDVYCDRRRLGIDARLELFCRMCSAVTYAHRNLVIHHDLKASNILVTDAGVPKLLDFGIAEMLDPDRGVQAGEATAAPLRLLTPGCASPEQVGGGPVTTAGDIYSLGAVLYQLLCGRRPYRSAGELGWSVRKQEPQRPSVALVNPPEPVTLPVPDAAQIAADRGLDVRSLVHRLRGGLDTVVLHALRQEPEARYPSVEHLVEDVERYRCRARAAVVELLDSRGA